MGGLGRGEDYGRLQCCNIFSGGYFSLLIKPDKPSYVKDGLILAIIGQLWSIIVDEEVRLNLRKDFFSFSFTGFFWTYWPAI